LPPDSFGGLFPFFIEIDADFRLRAIGASLRQACPDLELGTRFDDAFLSLRPDGEMGLEGMRKGVAVLRVLVEKTTEMQLRGQCLATTDGGLLFLGSPWLSDTSELGKLNLRIEDFALHDPAVDLLHILRSQKMATDDLRRLTDKLKTQRTQLKEANARLTAHEAETRRLALIAERTDNAVLLADPQGRAEWVNAGFTRLTGYTPEEVIGRVPGEMLQGPGTDPDTVAYMRERLRAKESFRVEVMNYHKSGRRYWVSFEVQPIFEDDGQLAHFMAIENDTTARRATSAGLRTQFRVSQILATDRSIQDIDYELVEVIGSGLEWDVVIFWILDAKTNLLQRQTSWAKDAKIHDQFFAAAPEQQLSRREGLPGLVGQASSAQWIEKLERYPDVPRSAAMHRAGFVSAVATPIRIGDTSLGVIELVSQLSEPFDEDRLRVFTAIGSQIAQFVERSGSQQKLQQRSEELLKLNQELADANKAKDEFLASISHEIRTPLNGVIGAADALNTFLLNSEQRMAVETIEASASHLHSLLNDVLDFSRIEAGHLEIIPEPTRLAELIESTTRIFHPVARQKNLRFEVLVIPPTHLVVMADPTRLRQVLVNLLGNAFKFTQAGKVQLSLDCQPEDDGVGLTFRIQDTGIGIPPDRADQLFKPFSQLDSSRTRRFGGTGLGLAISRQLVTMMGGTLELESSSPAGSIFRVKITTPRAELAAVEPTSQHHEFDVTGDVLVVDDNPFNAQVIGMFLRRLNLTVHHCFNAIDALAYCAEVRPPIILMDLHMPDIDGVEATLQLRNEVLDPAQPHIPIIALTADVRSEVRKSCLESGMDDFLPKPVRLNDLRATLARHLRTSAPRELNKPADESTTTPDPSGLDLEIVDAVFQTNSDAETAHDIREMFDAMWADIAPTLQRIRAHQKSRDIKTGQEICHGLLGVVANFGFRTAAGLLRKMENDDATFLDPDSLVPVERALSVDRIALLNRFPFLRSVDVEP